MLQFNDCFPVSISRDFLTVIKKIHLTLNYTHDIIAGLRCVALVYSTLKYVCIWKHLTHQVTINKPRLINFSEFHQMLFNTSQNTK